LKYAKETIELLSAYPGRDFRMIEIVRYVGHKPCGNDKHRVRIGVARVIKQLLEAGSVATRPLTDKGSYKAYHWKIDT